MNIAATPADTTGPTIGGSGAVSVSSQTETGLTLAWTAATDDGTTASALQYEVRQSSSNNITTLADAETNGTIISPYSANYTSKVVTGLTASTTYYFTVIAKDGAGNKSVYVSQAGTTAAPVYPDALTAFSSGAGASWLQVNVSLTYPATKADYSKILIYRSAPSDTSPATAPSCGSGVLIKTISDFTVGSLTFEDYTPLAGKYYGYRACIYNASSNVTNSNTITTAQSATGITSVREFDAQYRTGALTSGDIGNDSGTTTWTDIAGGGDFAFVGFDYNSSSGWQGVGTTAEPYRLKFDGVNDRLTMANTYTAGRTYSVWFKTGTVDATARYLYHAAAGVPESYAYIINGIIFVRHYANVNYIRSGIDTSAARWHHLVVTRSADGNARVFLDGSFVGTNSSASAETNAHTLYVGSNSSGTGLFTGEMSEFKVYSSAMTADQVLTLHASTRERYYGSTSGLNQIVNGYGLNSDGHTLTAIGSGLAETLSALIGGNAAGSFALRNGVVATFTAPIGSYSGTGNVVLNKSSGTLSAANAHHYTTTYTTGLSSLFDPRNIDTLGSAGTSSHVYNWMSLVDGFRAVLRNFNGTSTSGFVGDDAVGNLYRLRCDGVNDYVSLNMLAAGTYVTWFNPNSSGAVNADIFNGSIAAGTYLRINSGVIYSRYNGETQRSFSVSNGTWYMHVMTFSAGTAYQYAGAASDADLTLMGSSAATATSAGNSANFLCATSGGGSSYFDGSIGEFRTYSGYLDPTQAETLFDAMKARFQ